MSSGQITLKPTNLPSFDVQTDGQRIHVFFARFQKLRQQCHEIKIDTLAVQAFGLLFCKDYGLLWLCCFRASKPSSLRDKGLILHSMREIHDRQVWVPLTDVGCACFKIRYEANVLFLLFKTRPLHRMRLKYQKPDYIWSFLPT
jgi:hypothetical protein